MDADSIKKNISQFRIIVAALGSPGPSTSGLITEFNKTVKEFEKKMSKAEEAFEALQLLKGDIFKHGETISGLLWQLTSASQTPGIPKALESSRP